jgi:phosphoribosyl-ATP pyrophosphohydrolase
VANRIKLLYNAVVDRRSHDPSSSRTAKLMSLGRKKMAQKLGEEATEVVIEAVKGDRRGVIEESADVLYHLVVLWADLGIKPADIWAELDRRQALCGIAEKLPKPGTAIAAVPAPAPQTAAPATPAAAAPAAGAPGSAPSPAGGETPAAAPAPRVVAFPAGR